MRSYKKASLTSTHLEETNRSYIYKNPPKPLINQFAVKKKKRERDMAIIRVNGELGAVKREGAESELEDLVAFGGVFSLQVTRLRRINGGDTVPGGGVGSSVL